MFYILNYNKIQLINLMLLEMDLELKFREEVLIYYLKYIYQLHFDYLLSNYSYYL